MKLGLINSAWAQAGRGTAYGIRKTREIGFDTIDIFADPLDMNVRERRLIPQECERAGLPIISITCVATGLIDFNPSVQRFHLQRCRAYLDLAHEYHARNVLLVLGEYIWEKQVIPAAEQWQTAVTNLRELGKYAADLDVQIAVELEPFKLSLVNNVASMVKLLDDVNHPAVKANIDISHLELSHTRPEELRRLRSKAIHVHISDCDGKMHGDLPPGRGVVNFIPYLREIKDLGIDGTISIELEYSPQPDKIVDWVREAYQATDRLLSEAGLRSSTTGASATRKIGTVVPLLPAATLAGTPEAPVARPVQQHPRTLHGVPLLHAELAPPPESAQEPLPELPLAEPGRD
jgi:D-psicose/D-tagatose/L-ribulose 3-epimerase